MKPERIIIVGGPSRGKSTLAHELWEQSGGRLPVFCGDPASKVLFQKPYTHYLPEGLDFSGQSGAAAWVAEQWFRLPRPWVCEGHVMARALRRHINRWQMDPLAWTTNYRAPCDRIIVLDRPAHRETNKGQEAMHRGVLKVWREIAHWFEPITEYRR